MTCGEEVVSRNVTCEMENLKNVTTELKCGKCEQERPVNITVTERETL